MTLFTGTSPFNCASAEVRSSQIRENTIHTGRRKHIADAGVQRAQCHSPFPFIIFSSEKPAFPKPLLSIKSIS